MNTDFIIKALDLELFIPLMSLDDRALAAAGAKWVCVDSKPGFPCRVSLVEAQVGERVMLVNFVHLDTSSPYRSSGPIFVREQATTINLSVNEIPEVLHSRLLSLRGYSSSHDMIEAVTAQGGQLKLAMHNMFANPDVGYVQIHNANPGCFSCAAYRA
ncbi:DUF1203 domain-containing protein [Pseudoalteromonas byunsanensis]|uniref:DUF1203 domain-containing protein n=1 Tax=Pseudoalteromonas byunsanensis TaxID=327939 RepID=A0A1S1N8J8_9GAMM|nr:DUF1203 domain-containing protein [Pseudoalteromonas byunsanensis]OHU95752.1 hypothetical protein BIW53_07945 [Pseudoalteromonas byunsanensis]